MTACELLKEESVERSAIVGTYKQKNRLQIVQGITTTQSSGTNMVDLPAYATLQDYTNINNDAGIKPWATDYWFGTPQPSIVPFWATTTGADEEPNQKSIGELIDDLRDNYNISYAEKLADRLQYLVKVAEEDYPDQMPVSPKSLSDFIGFIGANNTFRFPSVYLTFSGNIMADWGEVKDEHFSIEFLGDNNVRFVVFAPDIKRPYKVYRTSGSSVVDKIMGHVVPFKVLRWVSSKQELA